MLLSDLFFDGSVVMIHNHNHPTDYKDLAEENALISGQCAGLICVLQQIVHFDAMTILGYQNSSQPVCLYRSSSINHNRKIRNLQNEICTYDPFYAVFNNKNLRGVYKASDLLSDNNTLGAYRTRFRMNGDYLDEMAVSIPLDTNRKVVIFIQRSHKNSSFSSQDRCALREQLERLTALCHKLWPSVWAEGVTAQTNGLAAIIHDSLTTFGSNILTSREQEIISCVIQGDDNKAIAQKLEISVATVKVHRKTAYSKFDISSMGELFQMFLNHLVLSSTQPTSGRGGYAA